MIDSVRQTVQAIANKNNRGYITPSDFNLYAKLAQLDIFEDYFGDINSFVNKRNSRLYTVGQDRGMNSGVGDSLKEYEEVIDRFSTLATLTGTGAERNFPADAYKMLAVFSGGVEVEKVALYLDFIRMSNSNLSVPNTTFPIYYSTEDTLTLSPTPAGAVTANYVRQPLTPNWTYTTLVGGEPIFNPSAVDYQDFELPVEDEPLIVAKICQYVGISIREVEVYQFGQTTEIEEKQR